MNCCERNGIDCNQGRECPERCGDESIPWRALLIAIAFGLMGIAALIP